MLPDVGKRKVVNPDTVVN